MKTITYINGDYKIIINKQGTKIRTGHGRAKFPESIDLKITNHCNAGCAYCHELSTIKGKHAPLSKIIELLNQLHAGTEIAIGGGNPLAHPNINEIINEARQRSIIPNITINEQHIPLYLQNPLPIMGLGISLTLNPNWYNIDKALDAHDHVIFHIINNIHPQWILNYLTKNYVNAILILGYKRYGFGLKYEPPHPNLQWQTLKTNICFDNLALEQLQIRNQVSNEHWNARYMGDDGQFTMYIDLVTNNYAKNSTSTKIKYPDNVEMAFQSL